MIITCKECSTQFSVSAEAIPAGGCKVKCANCQNVWHYGAKTIVPFFQSFIKNNFKQSLTIAILFALTLILGIASINPRLIINKNNHLVFSKFSIEKEMVDRKFVFYIDAEITNQSQEPQHLSEIQIQVISKGGHNMGSTGFPLPQTEFTAGQTISLKPEVTASGNADEIILDI